LRQFHLKLAFAAARMPRKNIQDQLRAVDDPALGELLDVALLHRRKIAIKDNQLRLMGVRFRANFVQFTAPHERCGIRGIAHLENRGDDGGACAASQLDEFQQRFAALFARGHAGKSRRAFPSNAHEERAFGV
jgi:hypothetical protein